MKGTLNKTDEGWVVRWAQEDPRDPKAELPLHPEYQTILPLDLDLEGNEVEFDWCVIVEHYTGKGKEYAKLLDKKVICEYSGLPSVTSYTTAEYPELEGTMALCNDKIWDDIYEEYSMEQYPPFGGPFTDSISFIDWLKLYYKVPEKK
jgi:hypothetical protein